MFVLLAMRRIGVLAALLGAAGSLVIAVDQMVNIAWVLQVSALSNNSDVDFDQVASVNNLYTVADAALITIGAALVVIALAIAGIGKKA